MMTFNRFDNPKKAKAARRPRPYYTGNFYPRGTIFIAISIVVWLIVGAMFVPSCADAAEVVDGSLEVRFEWTPPTTGTVVDHYIVEVEADGGNWTPYATTDTNAITLTLAPETDYRIRVAGIDSAGRQGVYSVPSETYRDHGAPGEPGRPSWSIIAIAAAFFLGLFFVIRGGKNEEG